MGYATHYKLSWKAAPGYEGKPNCSHNPPEKAKFCADCGVPVGSKGLDRIVGEYIESHEEMNYALDPDGSTQESCKWYDHEKDLAAMSAEIRNVEFHLAGKGEESGDIWDAFALNGEVQKHRAEVVRVTSPKPWRKKKP